MSSYQRCTMVVSYGASTCGEPIHMVDGRWEHVTKQNIGHPATDLPPYVTCSCNHELHQHAGRGCAGKDSYGFWCACPSFELSQECVEAMARGEGL